MFCFEKLIDESNYRFNKIEINYEKSKLQSSQLFKQIYDTIQSVEQNLNKELDQIYNENKKLNFDIKNEITLHHDNSNGNENNNQSSELIKRKLYEYQDFKIKPSLSSIKFKKLLNSINEILSNSITLKLKPTFNQTIECNDLIFYNYDNDYDSLIKNDEIINLAFGENILNLPKEIPNNIENLWLRSGFNKEIPKNYIPKTIKTISIDKIDSKVKLDGEGIIPNSIEVLFLGNGFTCESLSFIPNTIQQLQLGKINIIKNKNSTIVDDDDQPFQLNEGITQLMLCDKFNYQLKKEMIPKSVTCLNICDIEYPLLDNGESIPSTVTELWLCDGFRHKLLPNMLPSNSIKELFLCNIKEYCLSIGSIPSGIEEIHLYDNFNCPLTLDILPIDSIKRLSIYNIKSKLEIGSIPPNTNGYESITFHDDFNQSLEPGIIPNVPIDYLIIHNIKTQLQIGSIPSDSMVKQLHLCSGFSQKISSLIIPIESLEELYINDINYKKVN